MIDDKFTPLAQILRPKSFSDFVGQEHLVGKNGFVRKLTDVEKLTSLIFWGPPGCGKTTLARIIAGKTKANFVEFSATIAKKEDIKEVIKQAKEAQKLYNQQTILFVDEIHRFNKAQQDTFLPYVENGTIILFGATTENPSFEVIGPLLSRSKVLVFNPLTEKDLTEIAGKTLKYLKLKIDKNALVFLVENVNSDARILINALEVASTFLARKKKVDVKTIELALQSKHLMYDKAGEEHYNTISAFIKSMRSGHVDGALYYLARMVEAGEDALFIARRMVIFASEDIGMAQPTALVVANEVFQACDTIGYPECAINLAHGVVYLASAKKDRSSYNGLRSAQEDVRKFGNLPIPLELRNPVTDLMKKVGYGKNYEQYPDKERSLLPEKLKGRKYYIAKKKS